MTKMMDEMIVYAKKVNSEIERLINSGDFEVADKLIVELESIIGKNSELESKKAVIHIMKGEFDVAEKILTEEIKNDPNNLDLRYNLAYVFEMQNQWLKSIEEYEKIVFGIEESDMRTQLIERIENIEEQNRGIIVEQIKNKRSSIKSLAREGKRNVHLLYYSQYCAKFINFVQENIEGENIFLMVKTNEKDKQLIKDVDERLYIEVSLPEQIDLFLSEIDKADKVYIHYLFDYVCEIITKFPIDKPLYWILWGGDLYNYVDMDMFQQNTEYLLNNLGYKTKQRVNKSDVNYLFRKHALREIDFCLALIPGDYKLLCEEFITGCEEKKFFYDLELESDKFDKYRDRKNNKKDGELLKFVVGNSRNPSNNHIDILMDLHERFGGECEIIMPLSYGGNDKYVDVVVEVGGKLFGEKFTPIFDYLNTEDYFNLLSGAHAAFYKYNRQQGVGNMLILLSLGVPIVINEDTTPYKFFKSLGINSVLGYSELESFDFTKEYDTHDDIRKIESAISIKELTEIYRNLL